MMKSSPLKFRAPFIILALLFALAALLSAYPSTPAVAQQTTPAPSPLTSPAPALPPPTRPAPVTTLSDGTFTLEMYFSQLPQGEVGLARVFGTGITGARGRIFDQIVDFFPADDGYYALIAAGIEQPARAYEMSIVAFAGEATRVTFTTSIDVTIGSFIQQNFAMNADRAFLLDANIERNEFARLESIFGTYTPEKLWGTEGFRLPINAELTSPFGAFRTLNNTFPTRHTGWDLRAGTGTPVAAIAGGEVAFAGTLDLRGNYVVIYHGSGVYSGYAHLSQIHVTRGESIAPGQIIGVSGNTGRSNGAHLHWDMIVNGQWVDGWEFIQMWLP